MSDLVEYEIRDGVAVVTLANPPVNALGAGMSPGIFTIAFNHGGMERLLLHGPYVTEENPVSQKKMLPLQDDFVFVPVSYDPMPL